MTVPPPEPPPSPIVRFLTGGRDTHGRSHGEILAWDDATLEAHHDYIQWLFPLAESSRAVPGSPVLTAADIAFLSREPEAQRRMEQAAARMIAFYARTRFWLAAHDHNQLRISRIIASLRLLHSRELAARFYARITAMCEDARAPVNATSRAYWAAALDG